MLKSDFTLNNSNSPFNNKKKQKLTFYKYYQIEHESLIFTLKDISEP